MHKNRKYNESIIYQLLMVGDCPCPRAAGATARPAPKYPLTRAREEGGGLDKGEKICLMSISTSRSGRKKTK